VAVIVTVNVTLIIQHCDYVTVLISAAMEGIVNELRSFPQIEQSSLTLEESMFASLDLRLRRQLEHSWSRTPLKIKQLIQDLKTLRKLFT
jgi:DNA excision repair protein ERCC-4